MSSFTGAAVGSSAAAQYNSVFSPDQLASMWANLQGQLKDSATKNLILQGTFYRSLDQGAKAYIAHKLMNEIGEPVLFALDGNGADLCYLGAPRLLNVGAGMLVNFTGASEAIWVMRPSQVPG
ncbi:mating type 2 HMG1 2, partial [Fusarium albosuccineum]